MFQPSDFYSVKSRGFLEFATPSLHYNFCRYNFTCFKFLPSASNSVGRVWRFFPLRGRGFESHLAPHIARFQGFISDRINLPREVHVPKRSIINHRWCLDVEVASEYIHLIGGIWKNLEFTCEEADLMPWPLYNKVASKGRSAQLQIGSNAASTLSFFYSVQVIIGYFIEIRYITICAITSAGSPKPPWMQKGTKGARIG